MCVCVLLFVCVLLKFQEACASFLLVVVAKGSTICRGESKGAKFVNLAFFVASQGTQGDLGVHG